MPMARKGHLRVKAPTSKCRQKSIVRPLYYIKMLVFRRINSIVVLFTYLLNIIFNVFTGGSQDYIYGKKYLGALQKYQTIWDMKIKEIW